MLTFVALLAGAALVVLGALYDDTRLTIIGLAGVVMVVLVLALPALRGRIPVLATRLPSVRRAQRHAKSPREKDETSGERVTPAAQPAGADEGQQPSEGNGARAPIEASAAQGPDADESASVVDTPRLVRVIDGRQRYHLPDCSLLNGHDSEALTVTEAVEEGFSACSRCAKAAHPVGKGAR